jgi:Raf kinase inhibitor-like YbhB/YbcL family protein
MKTLSIVAITAFAFLGLANFASAQAPGFQLSSPSFVDCPGIGQRDCPANSKLPSPSAIYNRTRDAEDGTPVNECSPDGTAGLNRSPALSWTNAPSRATSFAVTVFDSTAQVYHWGIYNIPAFLSRGLRENAGAAGSTAGQQTINTYDRLGYGGPCPPQNMPPLVHDYVFTVYALARSFTAAEVPPNSETEALVQALLNVRLADGTPNNLASASITGVWSSTPPPPPAQ